MQAKFNNTFIRKFTTELRKKLKLNLSYQLLSNLLPHYRAKIERSNILQLYISHQTDAKSFNHKSIIYLGIQFTFVNSLFMCLQG